MSKQKHKVHYNVICETFQIAYKQMLAVLLEIKETIKRKHERSDQ